MGFGLPGSLPSLYTINTFSIIYCIFLWLIKIVVFITGIFRTAWFSWTTESWSFILAPGTRPESARLRWRRGWLWPAVGCRVVVGRVSRGRRWWRRWMALYGLNKCPFMAPFHCLSSRPHVTAAICSTASCTGQLSPSTATSEAWRCGNRVTATV